MSFGAHCDCESKPGITRLPGAWLRPWLEWIRTVLVGRDVLHESYRPEGSKHSVRPGNMSSRWQQTDISSNLKLLCSTRKLISSLPLPPVGTPDGSSQLPATSHLPWCPGLVTAGLLGISTPLGEASPIPARWNSAIWEFYYTMAV